MICADLGNPSRRPSAALCRRQAVVPREARTALPLCFITERVGPARVSTLLAQQRRSPGPGDTCPRAMEQQRGGGEQEQPKKPRCCLGALYFSEARYAKGRPPVSLCGAPERLAGSLGVQAAAHHAAGPSRGWVGTPGAAATAAADHRRPLVPHNASAACDCRSARASPSASNPQMMLHSCPQTRCPAATSSACERGGACWRLLPPAAGPAAGLAYPAICALLYSLRADDPAQTLPVMQVHLPRLLCLG